MKSFKTPLGHINKCQICFKENLETILPFGHQPIVQNYLTFLELNEPETFYPLNLCRCSSCGLLQLDYIADPKIVFPSHYPYRTGLTNMLIRNFRSLSDTLEKKYNLNQNNFIIDIGSNDGTLLLGFKEKKMRVLGIEPTGAAKEANRKGVETIEDYFNKKLAEKIVKKYGKAKIIIATNVFAHINNLFEFLEGVKILLDKNGVFVSESQYFFDTFEKLEFDCVYHEHLRLYLLKPLEKLFSLTGLKLMDAERISAAGGSIRVYAEKNNRPQSIEVKKLILLEEKVGLYKKEVLQEFAKRAVEAKNELMALLLSLKKEGKRIVGISSPARSNTLLGFVKINNYILDYISEKKSSPKIGLFTPGTHIEITDEEKLFKEQPEYALVLSWHIGEELIKKLKELGYKGKFIIPLPKPKIVN